MIKVHYEEKDQPMPNQPWLPSVHGVVLNENGAILVHRREDHPFWALPGGKLNLGESIPECLKREMFEETGLEVLPRKLLGVFSSPEYVLSMKEMVFQPVLILFLCQVSGGELTLNDESLEFAWLDEGNIADYETFPLVKEIAGFVWKHEEEAFFDKNSFNK